MIDVVILLAQISVGIFFGISGFHKLFLKQRHETLVSTLKEDKVPLLWFTQWAVPITEFVGGSWLVLGFLPFVPALALFVVTLGACIFDAPARVKAMKPVNLADCIDCWLYLCETWLMLVLLLVMADNLEDVTWMMQLL